jgi:O-antigen/teichoic acid export membrane protein
MGLLLPFMLFGQATSMTLAYFSDEKKGCNNISAEMTTSYKIMGLSFIATSVIVFGIWNFFYITEYTISFVVLFLFAVFFNSLKAYYLNIIVIFDRYKLYLLTTLLSSLVLISIVLLKPSTSGYFLAVIFNSIILIIAGLYLHKQNHQIQLKSKRFGGRELFVLGWAAIPGMLVASFNSYVDRYTIGYFLDLEVVAYYSLAAVVGVGAGAVIVTSILKGSSVSILQILQENNRDKHSKLQKNINYILVALAVASTITYYFIGERLVINIFGEKYINSIDYILPLFLTIILNGLVQIYSTPLVQKKKLYVLLYIGIFVMIINVILNIFLLNFVGVKGVVLAMFLATLVNLIMVYFYSKKYFSYLNFPYGVIIIIVGLETWSLV